MVQEQLVSGCRILKQEDGAGNCGLDVTRPLCIDEALRADQLADLLQSGTRVDRYSASDQRVEYLVKDFVACPCVSRRLWRDWAACAVLEAPFL